MPTNSEPTKAKAAAEPGLALSASEDRLTPYPATDTTAMTVRSDKDRTRHPEPSYHVISPVCASLPNTTAPSQAIGSQQNSYLNLAQSQANFMKSGTFPIYSASPNVSAVDSRARGVMARPFQCTYCGHKGHNQETCRKQKRVVGCLNCGAKGHLEHQCIETSGSQCRYCLAKGHSEADCFILKEHMRPCTFCSKYGHEESRCYKKISDHVSKAHRVGAVTTASNSSRGNHGPTRSSELSMKSMVAPEKTASRLNTFMRVTVADNRNASHGHRAPVTQAEIAAITIDNTQAQTELESEHGQFQGPQPASRALPVNYILAPINGAKPNVLAAKNTNSNSSQEPDSRDRAAHYYGGQIIHQDRYQHNGLSPLPISESVMHEATLKRENSKAKSHGGPGASTTTRRREKSVNSSPTIYVFQDTMHNRRVQRSVSTDNPEAFEFQRKLMKERCEEAMRLRRAKNNVHC